MYAIPAGGRAQFYGVTYGRYMKEIGQPRRPTPAQEFKAKAEAKAAKALAEAAESNVTGEASTTARIISPVTTAISKAPEAVKTVETPTETPIEVVEPIQLTAIAKVAANLTADSEVVETIADDVSAPVELTTENITTPTDESKKAFEEWKSKVVVQVSPKKRRSPRNKKSTQSESQVRGSSRASSSSTASTPSPPPKHAKDAPVAPRVVPGRVPLAAGSAWGNFAARIAQDDKAVSEKNMIDRELYSGHLPELSETYKDKKGQAESQVYGKVVPEVVVKKKEPAAEATVVAKSPVIDATPMAVQTPRTPSPQRQSSSRRPAPSTSTTGSRRQVLPAGSAWCNFSTLVQNDDVAVAAKNKATNEKYAEYLPELSETYKDKKGKAENMKYEKVVGGEVESGTATEGVVETE